MKKINWEYVARPGVCADDLLATLIMTSDIGRQGNTLIADDEYEDVTRTRVLFVRGRAKVVILYIPGDPEVEIRRPSREAAEAVYRNRKAARQRAC